MISDELLHASANLVVAEYSSIVRRIACCAAVRVCACVQVCACVRMVVREMICACVGGGRGGFRVCVCLCFCLCVFA